MAAALAALPGPLARVLAGRPVRVDGQQLDVQVQLAIRLERLLGGWKPLPAPEARAHRLHEAMVFRGPTIEVGARPRPRAAGAGRSRSAPACTSRPSARRHGAARRLLPRRRPRDRRPRHARPAVPVPGPRDARRRAGGRLPARARAPLPGRRRGRARRVSLGARRGRDARRRPGADRRGRRQRRRQPGRRGRPAHRRRRTARRPPSRRCSTRSPITRSSAAPTSSSARASSSPARRWTGFATTTSPTPISARIRARRRCWRRISPTSRPLTSSPPASTRSATRARRTPSACSSTASPTTLRRERDLVHGFVNAVGLGGRARDATAAFAAALREGLDPAPTGARRRQRLRPSRCPASPTVCGFVRMRTPAGSFSLATRFVRHAGEQIEGGSK